MTSRISVSYTHLDVYKRQTPNYATIHIKCSSIADRKTKKHAEMYRIKEELKSFHIKKAYLSSKLYKIHLRLLDNTHPASLEYYLDFINRGIQQITYRTRITQANKLQKLINDQLPVSYTHLDVYKRQGIVITVGYI